MILWRQDWVNFRLVWTSLPLKCVCVFSGHRQYQDLGPEGSRFQGGQLPRSMQTCSPLWLLKHTATPSGTKTTQIPYPTVIQLRLPAWSPWADTMRQQDMFPPVGSRAKSVSSTPATPWLLFVTQGSIFHSSWELPGKHFWSGHYSACHAIQPHILSPTHHRRKTISNINHDK